MAAVEHLGGSSDNGAGRHGQDYGLSAGTASVLQAPSAPDEALQGTAAPTVGAQPAGASTRVATLSGRSARKPRCEDCFFHQNMLCALPEKKPCPTFRA